MKSVYTVSGILGQGKRGIRVCPWPTAHLPAGTKVGVRADVRFSGLGTPAVRMFDMGQTGASFNPVNVCRNFDRDIPDLVQLVDESTLTPLQLANGVQLWEEAGMVDEVNSPEFSKTIDPQSQREIYVEVENLDPAVVYYTIELFFDY